MSSRATATYHRHAKALLHGLAIWLIWLLAAAIGLIAWPFGRRWKEFDPKLVKKILVIRLDLLGDLVLSMPAVEALKQAYPQARISMLVLPYTAPLLAHYPFLDKVFAFDINRLRPSGDMLGLTAYRDLWRVLSALRAERFDLAVSLHGVWASLFTFASGAPFRAGYGGESFPLMLNLAVPGKRYRQKRHEAEYCLDIIYALDHSLRGLNQACRDGFQTRPYDSASAPADAPAPNLLPLPWAVGHVDAMISHEGGPRPAKLVALHVGATNGTAKRWTTEGMAALADRLIEEVGATIVFTGSKGDLPAVEEVTRLMGHSSLALAGRTSIPELVALLARCRAVVSGDTGPMHLANALGVPVVAIHGPSDPALSGPYGDRAVVVRKEVPCGPCYDLTAPADCPKGDPICMTGIGVDEVYAAVKRQLAS